MSARGSFRTIAVASVFLSFVFTSTAWAQYDADLKALGIRKISGKYIDLYTDLPESPAVEELPEVFDAATPLIFEYFHLEKEKYAKWRVRAMLMRKENAETFTRGGIFPSDLPPFLHGYAKKRDLWVYEQEFDYYRRHLLLHEAVHSIMAEFLEGMGPPWYAEGMAELLATHHWKEKKLTIKYFPKSNEEALGWGRVKVLRDAVAAKEILTLEQIYAYDSSAHRVVPPYAWSWAAATFFEGHPEYGGAFTKLQKTLGDSPREFEAQLAIPAASRVLLEQEWQSFISEADYGCDVAKTYLVSKRPTAQRLDDKTSSVRLRADLGWQSTGFEIQTGKKYRLKISGKYTLRQPPAKWESEPQGVTIHYYRGKPLGMVLGAVIDETKSLDSISPLLSGAGLGTGSEFTAKTSGILYLRVNESAGGLTDNAGEFTLEFTPL